MYPKESSTYDFKITADGQNTNEIPVAYMYIPSKNITVVQKGDDTTSIIKGNYTPPGDYYTRTVHKNVYTGEAPKAKAGEDNGYKIKDTDVDTCTVYIPYALYNTEPIDLGGGVTTAIPGAYLHDDYGAIVLPEEYDTVAPSVQTAQHQESYNYHADKISKLKIKASPETRVDEVRFASQNKSYFDKKEAYTDEEIAAAGVKLEQTPLQQLSDYEALSQILQSNIPKNVFTEQAVAQATALADAKTTAEQLGLPSLAEYIKLYTESADTQNAATRQALELAAAQLYDRVRKQDLEWLASQTETSSKKASADSGAQAAALLETLANAKGENLESIVKNFSDNLATAEEMQKALNEAYAAGQAQYDTGRLNIAQHTNDANAIAAQNLATIGALYEAAQQSENSFNKSKAEHATAIQNINSRAQTELASDIIASLTQQQDNEIQRRTIDSIVRNILSEKTKDEDGAPTDGSIYSTAQAAEVLSALNKSGIYDADENKLTADAIKLLRDATQDVDYSYLQKDATAQAVLGNKAIDSVLFDPYEQARRTRAQTLDEYARSIGVEVDPRYYAGLYDAAAVNAFKTYDTQRKHAEQAMLRNLIAGDQSTNAPLRKRTLGAMTNNDRITSAATQLSNAQNNAAANEDAVWSAYTAEKTAPAKEAAARSKAATDALAYYQNLMTGYESGGTGGVLQQLNKANKNAADNLATYGSLAQQGMAGLAALNDANTSITNTNADARSTYIGNINTLNKNRSIQNLREQAFAKQASAGTQLGKYNISIN